MKKTAVLLTRTTLVAGALALGLTTPALAVMPHDPPPGAGRVEVITVERPVEQTVVVPAEAGRQVDQLALGAVGGLAVGLLCGAYASTLRRRRVSPAGDAPGSLPPSPPDSAVPGGSSYGVQP